MSGSAEGGECTAGSAIAPPRTFVDAIIASILTPGASSGLIATINVSLLLLLVVLFVLFLTGSADIHALVLGVLAVGLLLSFNHFMSQLRTSGEETPGGSASAAQAPAGDENKKDA